MSGVRRSSRANKGQHSRDALELYYVSETEAEAPLDQNQDQEQDQKRRKIDSAEIVDDLVQGSSTSNAVSTNPPTSLESQPEESLNSSDTEEVRCDPCGTTTANYNEATDNRGVMIECEKCQTWQHAKCMGYRHQKAIPKAYTCNRCVPPAVPKDKTRASVLKALYNVVLKQKDVAGCASDEDAHHLAERMEEAIYMWSGTTDKKYIDKSRSVMALVKKPAVLTRAALGSLAMASLALLPPEEIDAELKDYAEKVRQELIRRSVLTVEEDAGQRIRRTHKGEEVVETSNSHTDDAYNVNIVGRRVDHRKFDKDPSPSVIVPTTQGPNIYLLHQEDEEDADENVVSEEANAERVNNDSDSDDELDFILNRKSPAPVALPKQTPKVEPKLPPVMPKRFWNGHIAFPDFANFDVDAEFVGCTKYQTPRDITTAGFHNRAIRICKELFEKSSYLIEGRLDRSRADPYLSKIVSSRDLYLVQLVDASHNPDYEKLFEYLLSRSKVGVLSNRASFVKDAYVFAVDGNAPPYMDFGDLSRSLYALFVVKKDYVPVGKSILKKSLPPQPAVAVNSLDSILSKLESGLAAPGPQNLNGSNLNAPHNGLGFNGNGSNNGMNLNGVDLNSHQVQYLTELMHQNPHVQHSPQALLNLIQNSLLAPFP